MKIQSLSYVSAKAMEALKRFPATIFASILAALLGIYMIERESLIQNIFPYINALLSLALGIPLFFCAQILSESRNFKKPTQFIVHSIALILLVLIYISLPTSKETMNTRIPYIRYGVYSICIHLIISFVPFLGTKKVNGFWQFNKSLFIRILSAALYSGVIYIGLVVALITIEKLFGFHINSKRFSELFILIVGIFNTWFFVYGVPKNIKELELDQAYPRGLKIFAQYVLLPLVTLYVAILYTYIIRVVYLWDWPKGIISWLISIFCSFGVLTFLLLYPYGKFEGKTWINKWNKVFYYLLIPLTATLFFAILLRINHYGITVNRYAIILLGIWLSFISLYFIIGKRNIKIIPMSLALLILLSSFGPWSMFSVSEKSQVSRLKKILEQEGLFKNGKIEKEIMYNDTSNLPLNEIHNKENRFKIGSIISYLDDYHGFYAIKPWFKQDIDSILTEIKQDGRYYGNTEEVVIRKCLGISSYDYFNENGVDKESNQYNFHVQYSKFQILDIQHYDYLIPFEAYVNVQDPTNLNDHPENKDRIKCRYLPDKNALELKYIDTLSTLISLNQLCNKMIENTQYNFSNWNVPEKVMVIEDSNKFVKYKVDLKRLSFEQNSKDSTFKCTSIRGYIYVDVKEKNELF